MTIAVQNQQLMVILPLGMMMFSALRLAVSTKRTMPIPRARGAFNPKAAFFTLSKTPIVLLPLLRSRLCPEGKKGSTAAPTYIIYYRCALNNRVDSEIARSKYVPNKKMIKLLPEK